MGCSPPLVRGGAFHVSVACPFSPFALNPGGAGGGVSLSSTVRVAVDGSPGEYQG